MTSPASELVDLYQLDQLLLALEEANLRSQVRPELEEQVLAFAADFGLKAPPTRGTRSSGERRGRQLMDLVFATQHRILIAKRGYLEDDEDEPPLPAQ